MVALQPRRPVAIGRGTQLLSQLLLQQPQLPPSPTSSSSDDDLWSDEGNALYVFCSCCCCCCYTVGTDNDVWHTRKRRCFVCLDMVWDPRTIHDGGSAVVMSRHRTESTAASAGALVAHPVTTNRRPRSVTNSDARYAVCSTHCVRHSFVSHRSRFRDP